MVSLNVAVEWLALLLHIWNFLGSDFGTENGYPDVFMFLLSRQANERIVCTLD
jgi:hypothetical protein